MRIDGSLFRTPHQTCSQFAHFHKFGIRIYKENMLLSLKPNKSSLQAE